MKYTTLGLLVLGFHHEAQATEQCSLRALGIGNTWIISGYGTECEVKKVVTPNLPCRVKFDHDHGLHSFSCENGLNGTWTSGAFGSDAAGLSFNGASTPTKFPRHTEERKTWLAAIDREGLYKSYPIEMSDYYKYYPMKFTKTSDIHRIDNPEFTIEVRSYQYTTKTSGSRVAIASSVVRDCLTLRFVSWVKPQHANTTERHMSSMLSNLRLELVNDTIPEARRNWICRKPSER